MKRLMFTLALLFCCSANAGLVVSYDLEDYTASNYLETSYVDSPLWSATNLVAVGTNPISTSNHFWGNDWGTQFNGGQYFTNTITATEDFFFEKVRFSTESAGGESAWRGLAYRNGNLIAQASNSWSGADLFDWDIGASILANFNAGDLIEFRWQFRNDSGLATGFANHQCNGGGCVPGDPNPGFDIEFYGGLYRDPRDTPNEVSEPHALAALGLVLMAAGGIRRRRKNRL